MNRDIKWISHLFGFLKNSLSTLSVAMVKKGKSLTKLLSKICAGSNGMNFKKRDDANQGHKNI